MSLKKQYLKSKPVCKVTFRLPAEAARNAKSVKLIGDFNDWSHYTTSMKKLKNGDFTQVLDLAINTEYQFRYLIDDSIWENDWQADAYVVSTISHEDNSVVRV